jgi:uncharacterized SAM-binding protein YcdF (DUF218 family)
MPELKKSCFKCCALWFGGIFAGAALLCVLLLGQAGRWLSAADVPQRADAIVVLGGAFERTLYAAELYAAGKAGRVYLSNPVRDSSQRLLDGLGIKLPDEHEISTAILKRQGVAEKDILPFPGTALSTADEAALLQRMFAGQRLTIMVVTSPFHIRRARMIIGNALADGDVTALFVATPHDQYTAEWWTDQDSARNTLLELAKIAYYIAGGRFRSDTTMPGER